MFPWTKIHFRNLTIRLLFHKHFKELGVLNWLNIHMFENVESNWTTLYESVFKLLQRIFQIRDINLFE